MELATAFKAMFVALAASTAFSSAAAKAPTPKPVSIVLVHGAFVDGSGWRAVHDRLTAEGFEVIVVQNSTQTLEGDVATTRQAIAEAKSPVVLVGHSYGGAVITAAGIDPKVKKLVYVAAFVPDVGDTVADLNDKASAGHEPLPILVKDGFLMLDRTKFAARFAPDAPAETAAFMAASQVPWGLPAATAKTTSAAWKDKPTVFIVTAQDRIIPAEAQRQWAAQASAKVYEVPSSHAAMVSHPAEIAKLIETAAADVK